MIISSIFKADLSRFECPALDEAELASKQIIELRLSLQKFGLFSPLIVKKTGTTTLSVLNGKKRLALLKEVMTKSRTRGKIPYVVVKQNPKGEASDYLPLLSNRQKYHLLLRLIEDGQNIAQISKTLYASEDYVLQLASISRLSRRLKIAVLSGALTFPQAEALSTLPNHAAQERLLELLGPFVDAPTILAAIKAKEPVVNCDEANVIIMPSYNKTEKTHIFVSDLFNTSEVTVIL